MAYTLPHSTFVGVDISQVQIETGNRAIEALGLKNIQLYHMNMLDITPDFGQFDYIIAHGIYSWVPPEVRDKVIRICRANLSPNGIGYISYNVYPGWHMLQMAREMMLYHIRDIADPHERAEEARQFIHFLNNANSSGNNSVYASFLDGYAHLQSKKELQNAGVDADSAILHDELAEFNDPVYFYEFVEHLERHGLQYLSESEFYMVLPSNLPSQVIEQLQNVAQSLTDMEQYMDFLRNRSFRRTLVCHQEIEINRSIQPGRIIKFYIASGAKSVLPNEDDQRPNVSRFEGKNGSMFATDHPFTIAALHHLIEVSPQPLLFTDLVNQVCMNLNLPSPSPDDVQLLAVNLLKAYTYGNDLVEFYTHQAPFTRQIHEYPIASAYARYQAQFSKKVTNLAHGRVELDSINYLILPHLDGTHDRAWLLAHLAGLAQEGKIGFEVEGQQVEDETKMQQILEKELDLALRWLAVSSLLVDPAKLSA
jgi:methyltransferase-like protein